MTEKPPFQERITDEWLDQARQRTDPVADGILADIVRDHGPRRSMEVFDLLIRNVEIPLDQLPENTRDYFSEYAVLPPWADEGKIKLAEKVFLDHGPRFLVFLYYKSLPILYSCKNGAPVLTQTGRLAKDRKDTERFTRRIAETGQFLLEVMLPGGMQPEGQGMQTVLKVRLIHAAIRNFLLMGEWDIAGKGKPINQEDMAITLMTFSISLVDALPAFNLSLTEEETEAYLHHWKVIGHLLGLEEYFLPDTPADARFLLNKVISRQSGTSEEGILLTSALMDFARITIPGRLLDHSPEILVRHLIGDEMASTLGIRERKGCINWLVPRFLRRLFRYEENMEVRFQPVGELLDRISIRMLERMVGYFDRFKNRPFEVNRKYRKKWGLGDTSSR